MIRPALPTDALAIATIHVRAWQVAYQGVFPTEFLARLSVQQRTEFWLRELNGNRSSLWVAEDNGAISGWVSGGGSRDADALGASEVYAVYVMPERWRDGIGRQLMSTIEARLSARGDITLWVLTQNRRAIDFYQAIGYAFDGGQRFDELAGVSFSERRLRKKMPGRPSTPAPFTPPAAPRGPDKIRE